MKLPADAGVRIAALRQLHTAHTQLDITMAAAVLSSALTHSIGLCMVADVMHGFKWIPKTFIAHNALLQPSNTHTSPPPLNVAPHRPPLPLFCLCNVSDC